MITNVVKTVKKRLAMPAGHACLSQALLLPKDEEVVSSSPIVWKQILEIEYSLQNKIELD